MLAESYRVLGVPFGAGMPQIRQAYRQLVLQYHPDRNSDPNAHTIFLQVQAAYEYLQQFQASGVTSSTSTGTTQTPESKPQTDWEKYQYVYDPPADPEEYKAWATVARERARIQKEKDEAKYLQRMLAFKQTWWYWPAWLGSLLIMLIGLAVGVAIILLPLWLWLAKYQEVKHILFGCILSIIGIRILYMMKELRQDIRKYFGEDL